MNAELINVVYITESREIPQIVQELLEFAGQPPVPPMSMARLASQAGMDPNRPWGDVILLEVHQPGVEVLSPIGYWREAAPNLPIVVLSHQADSSQAEAALQAGAQDFLDASQADGPSLGRVLYYASALHRAKMDRNESEDRFLRLSEATPIGYYQAAPDGKILLVNTALVRMLGYSCPKELVGSTMEAVGSSLEYSRSVFHQLLEREGQVEGLESIWITDQGMTLFARESARVVRDARGEIQYYQGTVEDITERVMLETSLQENQARWGGILDSAMDAILTINDSMRIVYMNAATEEMFGYSVEEMVGQRIDRFLPSRFRMVHEEHIRNYGQSDEVRRQMGDLGIVWGVRKDSSEFPIEASLSKVQVAGHTYYTAIMRDISIRIKAQEDMRLAAQVFNETIEGIIITDANADIVSVNRAFSESSGYSPEEVTGKNPRLLKSGRHDEKFYEHMWASLNDTGHWRGEIWNRRKDGEVYPEYLTISTIKDESGRVVNYLGIFIDITARVQNEALLRFLATHDPLTNLPNRDLFRNHLRRALARAHRNGKKVAVLMMDLDGFKEVNDSLGHLQGDLVLKGLAERLVDCVRESDTVARHGGDEFTVILEGVDTVADVETVVHKILRTVSEPFRLNGHQAHVTTSIGVSLFPDDGNKSEHLIQRADEAMYWAKENGKAGYQFYRKLDPVHQP